MDERFTEVLTLIENGEFGEATTFVPILNALRNGNDYYLLAADFPSCKLLITSTRSNLIYRC